ncbi:g4837 [Coccomyxa elongata]
MLALSDADGEDNETWEDLLEMEESVWDPHAGAGFMTEILEQPNQDFDLESAAQDVPSVTMASLQEWVKAGAEAVCIIDVSPSPSGRDAADAATLGGAQLLQVPLDMLRAERVEQLKKYEHVLVTTSESGPRLEADRRCWQACVRLRRVYGLQQAAILERD